MVFVLFAGILALFVLYIRQADRIGTLERMISELRTVEPEARREVPVAPRPDLTPEEREVWQRRRSEPLAAARAIEMLGATAPVSGPDSEGEAESEDLSESEGEGAAAPARETLSALFERYVGGRLLIWIGGIALALAGIFLVRYSIQIGLIGPTVRMIVAGIFGLLLVGAAEVARARPGSLPDPRVPQALVGAGILVLYATPYGALVLYHLISNQAATILMIAVTLGALLLSLRHGMPAAILGLVGGFATPALVGDPHSSAVPLLSYLGLLDVALFAIAWRRSWSWLAAGAVALSFAWSFYLVPAPVPDALAGGLFVVALSIGASLLRAGEGRQLDLIRPVGIGLIQIAFLVGRTDLGLPAWGLFAALAVAAILLSGRRREFELLPVFALALALVLLAMKTVNKDMLVPVVAPAIAALFGLSALAGTWRSREPFLWAAIGASAFAAPFLFVRLLWPELLLTQGWGAVAAGLAVGPFLLAWIARPREEGAQALRISAAAILLLLGFAIFDLAPADLRPAFWLVLAAGTAWAAQRLADRGLFWLGLAAAAFASVWAMCLVPGLWGTIGGSVAGIPALASGLPSPILTLEALILPAALLFLAWHWLPDFHAWPRRALLIAAGLFLVASIYIFAKQVFHLESREDFTARGFAERMILTQIVFLAGWLLGGGRIRLPWLDQVQVRMIGTILTALAAARLVWFDMLVDNPVLVAQRVGTLPVLNLLLPAFLLSALWLYAARRRADGEVESGAWLVLFLAALIAGLMLMVRQAFQGVFLNRPDLPVSEFYGYSLAGLLMSIALLFAGIRLPDKALRIAGLALLTATIVKVFGFDAAALEGIWRILSFLGLGIALIGIGIVYSTVLRAEARPAAA
jgi:uncharacterized membrane protein